jgi:hypothetical protein
MTLKMTTKDIAIWAKRVAPHLADESLETIEALVEEAFSAGEGQQLVSYLEEVESRRFHGAVAQGAREALATTLTN